jgi:hypothetical protein
MTGLDYLADACVFPDESDDVTALPGNGWETGNGEADSVTALPPPVSGKRETPSRSLYGDVAGLLTGTLPDPPEPDVLACSDGVGLLYSGQVNHVFGDPESGKTWLCLAAVAETLDDGHRAAVIDLDRNGMSATVSRLLDLGAPEAALGDLARFRYVEPEDAAHLRAVVADLAAWRARCIVLDSLGELLPMFGASSNSPDDYTRVHSVVMQPLARSGAALAVVDHLAKGTDSRAMGATGTAAKKRAIGGVSLRVSIAEPYAPGRGGKSFLTIAKDRHGGLRANRPAGDKEPLAGTFQLHAGDGQRRWEVHAPASTERNPGEAVPASDLDALDRLDPPPVSVRDAAKRCQWRTQRASAALAEWRKQQRFPVSHTEGAETGNTPEGKP